MRLAKVEPQQQSHCRSDEHTHTTNQPVRMSVSNDLRPKREAKFGSIPITKDAFFCQNECSGFYSWPFGP